MTGRDRMDGLRIAVDARYLAHPGVGIHRYLCTLLDLLEANGAELTLLVSGTAIPDMAGSQTRRVVALRGTGARWEQWRLVRHLRSHRYDLYIAPANRGVPLLPHGTRTALIVMDLIPLVLWRTYLRRRVRFSIDYLLALGVSLARADAILAISESTAADIRRFSGRIATVVYVPDLPASLPHHGSGTEPTVAYNGGDDPRKQVPLLLEAFTIVHERSPQVRLRLIGRGYEHYRPLLADLGISDCVEMTGLVTEQEKTNALATASVVVLASTYEGFGLPMVEAFACGTPVVAGGGGALAEVGGDAVVRVDVSDPQSIADGISRALRPDVAERAAAAGRRRLAELRELDGASRLLEALLQAARPARDRRSVGGR